MAKEEYKLNALSSQTERDTKSSLERQKRKKNKKRKQLLGNKMVDDEQDIIGDGPSVGRDSEHCDMRIEGSPKVMNPVAKSLKSNEEEHLLQENAVAAEKQEVSGLNCAEEEMMNDKMADMPKKKKRKRLLIDAGKADRRGICYLSRIPPHMDHVKLRHILSQYGEIQRIYLAPEIAVHKRQVQRKKADGSQDQAFSEGWVEFGNKNVAKKVANALNGEQMGGKKRSKFYYDLWNIKYLSKFKWDDLTEEIAYKSAIREQKLALELSAAKRERDFYLSKVDKSRALSSIEERLKKKQKVQQETGGEQSVSEQAPKFIRQFPQTKPVAEKPEERKSQLSKDVLAGVFGVS
ncbi:pre-rRNA-processing protein ESF2 isoform X2 [Mercurialis annua]|uniref:pre-rRNA-processing protein ESF2 isoform X2 n=1 Tax=Mercurialis annua TaxID=3986 RepID=UPI00215DEE0A|nr:pre-rRNA-processing protein ESF2 isoform X2 [Mercurialis annua]